MWCILARGIVEDSVVVAVVGSDDDTLLFFGGWCFSIGFCVLRGFIYRNKTMVGGNASLSQFNEPVWL